MGRPHSPSPPAASGRAITRRGAIKGASGAMLASSAIGALAAAAPVRAASAPITLNFQPWFNFNNATSPAGLALLHSGLDSWLAQNKGVRVNIETLGYQGTMVAAILAGTGPDVFADWVLPPYVENNMLLNIEPYVKRDNVNMSIFPSGEMSYFYAAAGFNTPGALYCLPSYLHTAQMGVNLGILDSLGITYPEPGWTWVEWTKLWRQLTVKTPAAKQRFGGQFAWDGYDYYGSNPHPLYLKGFGGGYVDPTDATRSWLDQAGSIQAMDWVYGLVLDNVVGFGNVVTGQQATWTQGTAGDLPNAATAYNSLKWQIFHLPLFPKGAVSYAASDFYAINNATKYPELAWSLLKYLCVGQDWQRHMIQIALAGPNQKDLWQEFVTDVEAVAPTMRDKNLAVIADAVLNDEPFFGYTFKYADSQAASIIGQYTSAVTNHKMSWNEAGPQAARQIDALEAAGVATQAKAAAALKAVEKLRDATAPVTLPPPPVKGSGVPARLEPSFMVVGSGGKYTLLGDGNDVWNSSDNCVYACVPTTTDTGTWTLRVVSLSNVNCPTLSGWCKVGLMARADLSDDSVMVNLDVTGGNGIALQGRPLLTTGPGNQNGSQGKVGLMSAQYVAANLSTKMANYLLQPIWLRLVRDRLSWTGYTSLDGKNWTQAGTTTSTLATSMWMGIFACAHNGDFNNKGYMKATFDSVSFTPTHVYQIGTLGAPPGAGAVPKNWATI